jgi:lysophospholipase L1-like esterase
LTTSFGVGVPSGPNQILTEVPDTRTTINRSISVRRTINFVLSTGLVLASLAVSLGVGELVLRLKNSSMTNYDIEMWRYSKELKAPSPDPALDFDHVRSKSATLENVDIRLNEQGLRGGPIAPLAPGERRILFLGGSITLGWGVPEDQTVEAQLAKLLAAGGEKAEVLNGGVGNYNTERYVSRFFRELVDLHPTDIVVQYFLRDAEKLPPGGGNVFLRNSELAVTLWIAYHRLFDKLGEASLVEHYQNVYRETAPGFVEMKAQIEKLARYAKQNSIRIYLAMTPDVHNLTNYPFGAIHETMKQIALQNGYVYIDLLPALVGHSPQELWAMPGDPHPNALGQRLMASEIFEVLKK